jgi:hypothetical protein
MAGGRKRGRRTKNIRSRKMRSYRGGGGWFPSLFGNSDSGEEYTQSINQNDNILNATEKRLTNFGNTISDKTKETTAGFLDWWNSGSPSLSNGTQYSTQQTTMGGKGSRRKRRTKRSKKTRKT